VIAFDSLPHPHTALLTPTTAATAAVVAVNDSGPDGTPYEDGVFCATLTFPKDYPLNPPSMRFTSEVYHPNVYPDGRVCISILHPPGDDPNQYESRLVANPFPSQDYLSDTHSLTD